MEIRFFAGPLLIAAGVTAALVSGVWEPLTVGLVIAGTVTIALWLLYLSYEQSFWGQRSTQASTNALIATLAVFVILGVINFIAVRYPVRIDLTESQQFTLAPQTQQILRNLQQTVKVWVFDPTQNPQIKELLQSYKREGGEKFQFEFVDPLAQPGKAREFSITSIGEVYLQSGDKKQVLQKGGTAFGSDPNQGLSEIKLTNGLEEILSTRVATVYFLQGKGARPLKEGQGGIQQAEKALKDKYYNAQTLNLTERKEVPEDADALIVPGLEKPFSDTEIKALKAYLDRGGSLLLMVDPAIDTGLDKMLQEWGVKLDSRLAIDASGTGQRFGLRHGSHSQALRPTSDYSKFWQRYFILSVCACFGNLASRRDRGKTPDLDESGKLGRKRFDDEEIGVRSEDRSTRPAIISCSFSSIVH